MKNAKSIDSLILHIRNQKVILDADLAELYGVPVKALNQAVKRNQDRFPEDFLFRLTVDEKTEVVTNCDHLATLKFSSQLPYAFTEHGALQAANILKSPRAVEMGLYVIRAFVKQREMLLTQSDVLKKLAQIDAKLLSHDDALRLTWQELQPLRRLPPAPPKPRIGFKP